MASLVGFLPLHLCQHPGDRFHLQYLRAPRGGEPESKTGVQGLPRFLYGLVVRELSINPQRSLRLLLGLGASRPMALSGLCGPGPSLRDAFHGALKQRLKVYLRIP